jgi:hypothetical protein
LEVRKRVRSSIETPSRGLVSSWIDRRVRARSSESTTDPVWTERFGTKTSGNCEKALLAK